MEQETSTIVQEVKELTHQYLKEVPSGRKPWPKSIQERIQKLSQSGLTSKEISTLTSIPYYTIYNWSRKDPNFKPARRHSRFSSSGDFIPVKVSTKKSKNGTVTVKSTSLPEMGPLPILTQSSTVTVTLPNGIRVEGVTPEFLISWLGQVNPYRANE